MLRPFEHVMRNKGKYTSLLVGAAATYGAVQYGVPPEVTQAFLAELLKGAALVIQTP
jgi:hypothetical protein